MRRKGGQALEVDVEVCGGRGTLEVNRKVRGHAFEVDRRVCVCVCVCVCWGGQASKTDTHVFWP